MVSHIVFMRLRTDLSLDDRSAFIDAFERAIRDIPTVKAVRVGRRVTHGAGYEQGAPDANYLAVIDFEDLGVRFGQSLRSALVYDFEVGGLEDLRRWRVP